MHSQPDSIGKRLLRFITPGCGRLEYHYPPREITAADSVHSSREAPAGLPLISIVVPSFNQGQFLGQTLKSITDQGYPNLELIIVDGGSTDNTLDVIRSYESSIKWWVSEPDSGQANAINKGMVHATGDILAWLNSDDCLMPGALHRVAAHFSEHPDTDVVYGHRVLINESGKDVGKWVLPAHREFILTYADFIPQETMFWRRSLWQKTGGQLDESFRFALDWELIRRFLEADARFVLIPAFLGQFRMHETQKTNANIDTDGLKEMEVIRQRCRQAFSSHPALQNLYYRMQRASFYSFAFRARMVEFLIWARVVKID